MLTTWQKMVAGHVLLFAMHVVTIAVVDPGLSGRIVSPLLAIGPAAGLWGGLGPGRGRAGAFWLAFADVVTVHIAFWAILRVRLAGELAAHPDMMDEGLTLFAIFCAPCSILLLTVVLFLCRILARAMGRQR